MRPVTGTADDRAISDDELTTEDLAALGWAVSTAHPPGTAVVERIPGGGTGVTAQELRAIRRDWHARPGAPHRTSTSTGQR